MVISSRDAGTPLSLADADFVRSYLATSRSGFSESSFANLFLFAAAHDYRLIRDEHPRILGRTYDGVSHILPLFALADRPLDLLRGLASNADCFYPVEDSVAERFRGVATIRWNDDDSDYLYDAARLATLASPATRAKRQQAAAYAASNPEGRPMTEDDVPAALVLLDGWLADVEKPWAETDHAACCKALELRTPLNINGWFFRSGGGEPAGFLLGTVLPDASLAIHFAKGRRHFPGVFPFMFQWLANSVKARYQHLNFEQDLGAPGFRQAKSALGPVARLKKFRVSFAAARDPAGSR